MSVHPGNAQAFTVSTSWRRLPTRSRTGTVCALVGIGAQRARMIAKAPPILALVVDPLVARVAFLARAVRVQHVRSVRTLAIRAVVHRANLARTRRAATIIRGLRVDVPWLPAGITKGAMRRRAEQWYC